MGFRFSKRLNLPGGFRLNLGTGGLGVSWGVRGFRVGVGPNGARYTASVPGTGASWSGPIGAPAAKSPTSSARPASVDPAAVVAEHEALIQRLVSLHRAAPATWDWNAIAAAPPPAAPVATDAAATEAWRSAQARWQWFHDVAAGVLAGNVSACDAVLQHLGPFQQLRELGGSIRVSIQQDWCVEAWVLANRAEVVPTEQPVLTPTGKLSRRKLSPSRRWEIYQDHVCSAALRVARETFALLPIPVVFVHVADVRIDPATGHEGFVPVLSVAFDRESFAKLNLDGVDPSAAVEGFDHVMSFKKTTGFAEVVPLDPGQGPPES
jgi:hypothetical protein